MVFVLCPQAVRTEMTRQGGGVAALDGLMEPEQLAEAVKGRNQGMYLWRPGDLDEINEVLG